MAATRDLHAVLLLALLFAASDAVAAPVQLNVVIEGDASRRPPAAVHVELYPADAVAADLRRTMAVAADSTVSAELPTTGVWYARAVASGYWGETATIVAPTDREIALRIWPAATVRGTVRADHPIHEVTLRFQSVAPSTAGPAADGAVSPNGSSECKVSRLELECVIPAGRFDYSLRSPGYVPVFKWNQRYRAGESTLLGAVAFRRGSSLLGQIAAPRGSLEDGARVRVTLAADATAPQRPADDERLTVMASTVLANERGVFVFEGVKPGGYRLSAAAPGLLSEEREVTIVEGLQAELREPLMLTKPLTFSATIRPAVDPWKKPWIVSLARLHGDGERATEIAESAATAAGEWTRKGLAIGEYIVRIRRHPQGLWYSGSIVLTEDTPAEILIPLQKVMGAVTIGKTPLHASLWFGGEHGSRSVPVVTDADGTFKAVLPQVTDDVWDRVDIVASSPRVRRTLYDVRLAGPDDRDVYTFTATLPSNRLYGEVATEAGKPTSSDATVYAHSAAIGEAPLQMNVDDAGVFSFNGLADGTYSVHAIGAAGKSESTTISVTETAESYVKLVLKRPSELEGILTSPHGPVSGARVWAYPEDRTGFAVLDWARTGPDGRFRIPVPQRSVTATFAVGAPGYAYTFVDAPVDAKQQLAISVGQHGGRIVFEADASDIQNLYVFRGRAFLPLRALINEGVATLTGGAAVLNNVDPGQYDFCVATAAEAQALARSSRQVRTCVGGYLAPNGELSLRHADAGSDG
jgi:hypothetical protein